MYTHFRIVKCTKHITPPKWDSPIISQKESQLDKKPKTKRLNTVGGVQTNIHILDYSRKEIGRAHV